MHILVRSLTVLLLVFGLAACGGGGGDDGAPVGEPGGETPDAGAPVGDAMEAADGQAVFATNCAACHGDGGTGGGAAAVGLEPPPADLTDAVWTTGDGSLAAVRNVVENGSPGTAMIAWKGTLTDAEITAVAEHVHAMGGGQ